MFRFLRFITILFLLYISWPFIEKQLAGTSFGPAIDSIQSELQLLIDNPELNAEIDTIYEKFQQKLNQFKEQPQTEQKPVKKETLKTPARQLFSVYNVELGDSKVNIERHLGAAKRSTTNDYGKQWFAYHDHYQNFVMVMYDQNNKAVGLYTDQDLIASTNGIKFGSRKSEVRAKLGQPMSGIQKGLITYELKNNDEYEMFLLNGVYVTIFYDKHEGNTVTAMQLINQKLEQAKTDIYTKASRPLMEGFEFQLFDLTNASRVNHHLSVLTWDQHIRQTAWKHSVDMAVHHYFNHTDLAGHSPFDRMAKDHITFHLAGENLAYGQFNSIFAHEGLMNSLGHRENILRKGYEFLGVGVAFNNQEQPYYTENFYAK